MYSTVYLADIGWKLMTLASYSFPEDLLPILRGVERELVWP
jgi:hypothetical protein